MRRAALAALAGAAALALAACEDTQVHAFGAQRYNADQDCLEEAEIIDVLDGPNPGLCDTPRCWKAPSGEVYVTTTACDAPPDFVEGTAEPAPSPCAAALAALADGARCAP
ncbi:MAG: hypothetical protein IT372_20245 [Polyangiaceae bacterium]|nr:hypothetical protein [Polyangiaceae bacterium]